VLIGGARPGQPRYAQVMALVDAADPDTVIERLQPLAATAHLVDQDVRMTSYRAVISNSTDETHSGQGEPLARSAMMRRFTPEFAADAARFLDEGATYFFSIRASGGAVRDVPADATAYAHREAEFSIAAFGTRAMGTFERWEELIVPHASGAYVSFETEQGAELIERAFPPATLARLRAVKREVDPGNLFRDNANVGV
jgi:hypothetical protein